MDRSKLLKQNIVMALGVKAASIVISLVLVPMTINFVNPTQYGIWLTISSMVMWMSFFDVGFSNGMRNKLGAALAADDLEQGRSYVSTTYGMLSLIFSGIMILLSGLIWMLDMSPLLGIDMSYEPDLKPALTILAAYFCVNFVVRILSHVLKADQRTSWGALIDCVGQFFVLITVWLMQGHIEGSLTVLALALCLPPLMVWLIASIVLYAGRYRAVRPSFSAIHMRDARSLLSLGVKFFIIQIAFIIQFQTSNYLIARLFSMEQVTSYNIAYKYFNVMYMVFWLLIDPFWGAVTNAWSKQDIDWIRRTTRKYVGLAALFLLGGLVMLGLSEWVYDFWINSKVDTPVLIPFALSAWMLAYNMVTIWGQVFCLFVNGIGALKIQFFTSMISPILFIAVTITLAKVFGMGMESVLIGSIVANFNGLILAPLQYWMVIHRKRQGIWTA